MEDVFAIDSASSGIDRSKLIKGTGTIPYITRTDSINGIADFICAQNDAINKGNCITIGLDTQTVFYQCQDFYTGQNIQVLRSKHINKYSALFLIPLIRKVLSKFSWGGNGATLSRLRRTRIMLPVISGSNSEVDWDFMNRESSTRIARCICDYYNYIA